MMKKEIITKIMRIFLVIGLYTSGLLICDGTFWKEMILAVLVLIGARIQGNKK